MRDFRERPNPFRRDPSPRGERFCKRSPRGLGSRRHGHPMPNWQPLYILTFSIAVHSPPAMPTRSPAPPPPAADAAPGEALRVLVVDDDRLHAETVAEVLEKVGYACTVATSGTAGAAAIDRDEFDVILTDLRMNDLDGLAIVRKARQEQP